MGKCALAKAMVGGGIVVLLSGSGPAQVAFTEVTTESGLSQFEPSEGMISGMAVVDYDSDGDFDLFLPTAPGQPNRLYQNTGDGVFVDVAASVGLASLERARTALFFDYNGDGRLDLVVSRDCFSNVCAELESITLYQQTEQGAFVDVTVGSGLEGDKTLSPGTHAAPFSAGDINNDGWVDLVFSTWNGGVYLFINNQGDGTFTDISESSGMWGNVSFYWQTLFHDFDDDGWTDLFIAMDFVYDELWMNMSDGTFLDMAEEADCDITWNGMGATMGDIENDGDLDIYVTNISMGSGSNERWSTLYVNQGAPQEMPVFLEMAKQYQVDAVGWGWGTTFFDYNLDQHVDLAVNNGRIGGAWEFDASHLFRNDIATTGVFADVSDEVGFNDTFAASTLLAVDVDRDGDEDLLQTCMTGDLRLLKNNAAAVSGHNWLVIQPRTAGANVYAIGAIVRIRTGDVWQMRLIHAGWSMAGQQPAEAHFGLGSEEQVDELLIEWPDNTITRRTNIAADQLLEVVQPGCPQDIDASGMVDSVDLNLVLVHFGQAGEIGDFDGNGEVASSDLNALLAVFGAPCP